MSCESNSIGQLIDHGNYDMRQLQMFQKVGYGGGPIFKVVQSVKKGVLNRAVDTLRRQGVKRRKGA